jgi:RNA recognition motif-containing protein
MSTTEQQAKQPAPATAPEEKDAVGDFVDQYPHKVFVGNISFRTTEDQLKEFFASAGTV